MMQAGGGKALRRLEKYAHGDARVKESIYLTDERAPHYWRRSPYT